MRSDNRRPNVEWRLLAVVIAVGACSSRLASSTDAQSAQDGPVDLNGLFSSTSCGGTISFTGTTPNGAFHGDTVNVIASYGALTGVVVSIGDSQSGGASNGATTGLPPTEARSCRRSSTAPSMEIFCPPET